MATGTGAPAGRAATRTAAFLLACALAVPLLVLPGTFLFPYVATKVFVLRPLALASLAAVAAAVALGRVGVRRPGPVAWCGAALLAVAAASVALGTDPARGAWDTGERMLGLVTFGAAAAWFAAAVTAVRTDGGWRSLFAVSLAVACAAAAFGGLQAAGALRDEGDARIASTLGHPSYFGALGLHALFAAALYAGLTRSRGARALAAAAAVAGVAAIALGEARAAAFGCAVGAAAGAVCAAVWGGPRTRRALLVTACVAAAVCIVAVALRDEPFLRDVPLLRRLASSSPDDPTLSTRLLAWETALDAARERPLLGWGLNGYAEAFSAHFRPELLRYGGAETWFDDAHGVVFNTLAEQGVLGLAALGALHAAAVAALVGARARGRIGSFTAAAGVAWVAAHLGNLLFAFDDVSSILHVALVLGFCEHLGAAGPEEPLPRPPGPLLRVAAAAVALAAPVVVALADVRPAMANARARSAMAVLASDPRAAVSRMDASERLGSPHAGTETLLYAAAAREAAGRLAAEGREADAELLGLDAFRRLGTLLERRPRDLRPALLRARLAADVPSLRRDERVAALVVEELSRAAARAPSRQDLRFALADAHLRLGRVADAAAQVRAVVERDPDSGAGWARLAAVYLAAGRRDDARRILAEARSRGVTFAAADSELFRALSD